MDVLTPIRRFDRFQQRHTPLAVAVATIKKFGDDRAGGWAAMVAYYAFFSLFPLMLVFVTVLGYALSGDPALMRSVRNSVLMSFPLIGQTLSTNSLRGSAPALIAGSALSLWAGLGVTGAARNALDHVWAVPTDERAGFLRSRLHGLLTIATLAVLFVVSSAASGATSGGLGGDVLLVLGIIVSLLLNLATFLLSFRLLCSEEIGWRRLLPGAALAAVLWEVLQLLGGVYIGHFKHNTNVYGTFALVLGVLAWLHLGAQMTLLCAELNTVLADRHWPRRLLGEVDREPAGRAQASG